VVCRGEGAPCVTREKGAHDEGVAEGGRGRSSLLAARALLVHATIAEAAHAAGTAAFEASSTYSDRNSPRAGRCPAIRERLPRAALGAATTERSWWCGRGAGEDCRRTGCCARWSSRGAKMERMAFPHIGDAALDAYLGTRARPRKRPSCGSSPARPRSPWCCADHDRRAAGVEEIARSRGGIRSAGYLVPLAPYRAGRAAGQLEGAHRSTASGRGPCAGIAPTAARWSRRTWCAKGPTAARHEGASSCGSGERIEAVASRRSRACDHRRASLLRG